MLAIGRLEKKKRIKKIMPIVIEYRKAKKIEKLVLVTRNLRKKIEIEKPALAAVLSFF